VVLRVGVSVRFEFYLRVRVKFGFSLNLNINPNIHNKMYKDCDYAYLRKLLWSRLWTTSYKLSSCHILWFVLSFFDHNEGALSLPCCSLAL